MVNKRIALDCFYEELILILNFTFPFLGWLLFKSIPETGWLFLVLTMTQRIIYGFFKTKKPNHF
ncbi:MAG TPA: hypothetical protein DHU89_09830 [Flavobacteriales bacterium]|nr:hypothetical protein [Flavobacteriales bacterium]